MKKAHIYLNGQISSSAPFDFFSGDTPEYFNSKTVQQALDDNADANILHFHITSPGGEVNEAFAIFDKLTNSKKKIITQAEGQVASAATIVYLAGSERDMTKYAELMIHNPFIPHAEGDAEDLQKIADEMQRIQDKISNLYAERTGVPAAKWDKYMKAETYMSAEEAKELGFATDIIEPLKAVATLSANQNSNSTITIMNKILDSFKALAAKIEGNLNGTATQAQANALNLATADGRMLDIANGDKETPEIGMTVSVDGKTAGTEDFLMEDKCVISVVNGKIAKITEPTEGGDPGDEQDDDTAGTDIENKVNDRIQALEEGLNEIKSAIAEIPAVIEALNTKVTAMGSSVKSTFKPAAKKTVFTQNKKEGDEHSVASSIGKAKEILETVK